MRNLGKAVGMTLASCLVMYILIIVANSALAKLYGDSQTFARSRGLLEITYLAKLLTHAVPGVVLGRYLEKGRPLAGAILGIILVIPALMFGPSDPTFGYVGDPFALHATYVCLTMLATVAGGVMRELWDRPR